MVISRNTWERLLGCGPINQNEYRSTEDVGQWSRQAHSDALLRGPLVNL